jgi:TolA-binding protein
METAKAPPAEVTKVYQEAVTKYPGTPGADQAKKELARLSAPPPPGPKR